MDTESYDQVTLMEALIDSPQFLKDGDPVDIFYHAEKEQILNCELPQFVKLIVTYTEPGLKGDTATNASKPATLETGAHIQVPLFIDVDQMIKIDTKTGAYVERVK
jgi:elongation factor P